MSSDSEDDCYGNMAQKLQSIKSQYKKSNDADTACIELDDDSDSEEISLDAIIAQHSKNIPSNASKTDDNIITTRSRARKLLSADVSGEAERSPARKKRKPNSPDTRGRRPTRGLRGTRIAKNTSSTKANASAAAKRNKSGTSNTRSQSSRGRRRGVITREIVREFFASLVPRDFIPTFSIGNTHEYPDKSENQPLFSNQGNKDDVIAVENEADPNDSLDENEELSVKVYWQSNEFVKFTIRRYQKIKPIFDFFAKREKVDYDRLFFTYNDKVINTDDTPHSITYNEVKFIDGGVLSSGASSTLQNKGEDTAKDGIKLKFQCQNKRKSLEIYIKPEEKLSIAMIQYAEHLEKPMNKLQFIFDGDLMSGKNTPQQLEMEGGECIDVKIID